jgi:hypothetical protein
MDNYNTGSILGTVGFIVSMCGVIYTAVNHKRIRAKCCGKNFEVELHVDTTEEDKRKSAKIHPIPESTIVDIDK